MTHTYHKDHTNPVFQSDAPWVWVFGSNEAGRHGAGAARIARLHFKAVYGVGHGRTGNAYAIATKGSDMKPLPLELIAANVAEFRLYARVNYAAEFYVTRVGCGLAGYQDWQIAPLFFDAPANCCLPEEWRQWTEKVTA